jgi:hypothetical protein
MSCQNSIGCAQETGVRPVPMQVRLLDYFLYYQ